MRPRLPRTQGSEKHAQDRQAAYHPRSRCRASHLDTCSISTWTCLLRTWPFFPLQSRVPIFLELPLPSQPGKGRADYTYHWTLQHHSIAIAASQLHSSIVLPTSLVRHLRHRLTIMASSSGSGGTSLAPTPTHPHHLLSREPSREDIEMAQNLSLLNHSQDNNRDRMESAPQPQQSGATPEGQNPEIYHSLEDTRVFQQSEQPEETSTPAPSASTTQTDAGGTNAPLTGQICR